MSLMGNSKEKGALSDKFARDYGNDRDARLSVRVSKIEKEHYEEMAHALNKSLPDLVRGILNSAYKSGRWQG